MADGDREANLIYLERNMSNRISSFANAGQVQEILNYEPDISLDEAVSAIIGLSRHIQRLENKLEEMQRKLEEKQ